MVAMLNLKVSVEVTLGVASITVLNVSYEEGKGLLDELRYSIAKGECVPGVVTVVCSPDNAGRVVQKTHDFLWTKSLL
jgi:hypothetical protein